MFEFKPLTNTNHADQELTTEPSLDPDPPFSELSEMEIVNMAKDNPLAISYLYRQHYVAIFRYVYRRVGNSHDTHDIVAEVFLSMVRYLPRFKWTGAPFRCWLLVLTTTQINRWIRKRRFSSLWRPLELFGLNDTSREQSQDKRLEPMQIALLELPLHLQTTLTLFYFEELSIDVIANIMRCQPGTVKSRLSRGRELLKQKITYLEERNANERRPIGSMLQKSKV